LKALYFIIYHPDKKMPHSRAYCYWILPWSYQKNDFS